MTDVHLQPSEDAADEPHRPGSASSLGRPVTGVPVPLLTPRDGLPEVIADGATLAAVAEAFAGGSGPVAVDAERASGYRYGQRAYLIQLRRAGAGTALVDPTAFEDLAVLQTSIEDAEWVLHAAHQDLPCLAETGLRPRRLFDTELAGRLAGYPRVGLGPLVETVLGLSLEKGHSAADWSVRPLPEPWLRYAALDVEVLVELRDALEVELRRQNKLDWALQEFAAIAAAPLPKPRPEPWRRTSGMHRVHRRRELAIVRALWQVRDELARQRDVTPSRVLSDAAIVAAALDPPASAGALRSIPGFPHRRDDLTRYFGALGRARGLPDDELPAIAMPHDGPPPPRAWADRDPAAAARLTLARAAVTEVAERHTLPTENLLTPELVRRLCWNPPEDLSDDSVAATLRAMSARPWQVELTAAALAATLRKATVSDTGDQRETPA